MSYTYELAARRVAFEVQPEIFAIHYTTVTRGAKKAYGHSPVDWMVGETCWPAFRSRVKQAYRFDTTSCAQDATDRQVRRRYGCAGALQLIVGGLLDDRHVGGARRAEGGTLH